MERTSAVGSDQGKLFIMCLIYQDNVCCEQYEAVCSWSTDLGWPAMSTHSCVSCCDDKLSPSQHFCEGSFLRVLLDKLSRMLHQVQSAK